MVNLWDPHAGLALSLVLLTSLLLGVVHGITPDEHTWPITFSYAIGSYSSRKGLVAGLTFSTAFTLQRALASELAYLALDRYFTLTSFVNYVVYLIVGAAMIWAARYMGQGRHWHLIGSHRVSPNEPRPRVAKWWMPAMHGFIAGWGFGAFAIVIYTVLAPAMPSAQWGWVPGAVFGLGTTIMQASAGALFGWISQRMGLPPEAAQSVALTTAGRTLRWGGVAFMVGGGLGVVAPRLANLSIQTGIRVHNLDHLGIAFVLVTGTVMGIGVTTLVQQTRYWSKQLQVQHSVSDSPYPQK